MHNFIFHNPTKIDFGLDREQHIGEHLQQYGITKVLLVYGSDRIKKEGLFDTVVTALAAQQISYVELGGIVSNPVMSKVYEGIELARSQHVDAILAVGGGSVLDSAKAIAAGVTYQGDAWDLFIGKGAIASALPIFDILTLAATGSEMNSGAVVTNEKTAQKYAINSPHTFPKVSIVNPALMKTVSKAYLVYSAADIIAHSIEGYFTASEQPHLPSRLVETNIKTVIETTEKLLQDPDDYQARAEFAWASTLALNGLTYAGTAGYSYPNHMIEHSLSALYNVPHGAGLSVIIPAWMKWYRSKNPSQFARFGQQIFAVSAEDGIQQLEQWFNKIGTPTRLQQLGINASELPRIQENVQGNAHYFGIADIYTPEVILEILKNAL